MSFSENIKNEILTTSFKDCCLSALRQGEIITESKDINISNLKSFINNTCCKKSFIKGAFLGSGCVINPNVDYHFEITVKLKKAADQIVAVLKEFNLNPKIIKRNKNMYVVYIKGAEDISILLAILGANRAMLKYENIRIEKSIKNEVNRAVNCETANLSKVVNASYKQIRAIDLIVQKGMYDNLNASLKEVCKLRKENPIASLEDLSKMSSTPISKSGVYHRLKKIEKMAESL